MKLKALETELQQVDPFDSPKIELEQIPTSPALAARMIFSAENMYGDISDKIIGDFGSGPGMLSIACCMVGATSVLGFEVDSDALENAWVNVQKLEITNIDFVQMDIQTLNLSMNADGTCPFDTVVMNPPFGTRNAGIDTAFLEKAMKYSNVIYSLHKSSTREHFIRLAGAMGFTLEVVAEVKYDIPKTFKYHKDKSRDIAVDLLRFSREVPIIAAAAAAGQGKQQQQEDNIFGFGSTSGSSAGMGGRSAAEEGEGGEAQLQER
jgi:rRNA N6-adenosine-methyltransferase METTL5